QETWTSVDNYLADMLVGPDETLESALEASAAAGLPPIAVSVNQGKLLHLLARLHGSRRVLEVGTLGGYSAIWLARALPADGEVVSLEIDPHHAEVARENIARAGLSDRVDVRLGPALDVLPELEGPFDFAFIDADKPSNPDYLRWALQLSRPGTVIVVDNIVRGGAVADPEDHRPATNGSRSVVELIAAEPRLDGTAIQTVGTKGYDGFVIALVR
ncbi:MAG: O-methyltransferase, partial [Pseudonocardiaceae bacterium]